MAPPHPTARSEREKKVKQVCTFASKLKARLDASRDDCLASDLRSQILGLPLQSCPALTAKRDELEKLGTELWNLTTRLRRDEEQQGSPKRDYAVQMKCVLCLLRVFSFLLLDSAGSQSAKGKGRKNCLRLMKVALKAAKVCVENNEVNGATKVLECAAEYQDILSREKRGDEEEERMHDRLLGEYYALRTALAWRSDQMDVAEHMYTKYKGHAQSFTASTTESVADLLFEMGKDYLKKRSYETAVRWLGRANDTLGEQSFDVLSAEAGELRLSILLSLAQAHMKVNDKEARTKAWDTIGLLDTGFEDKMSVSLLKLEMLFSDSTIDTDRIFAVLQRMMRSVVFNEKNFKTIVHYIHKLKEHSDPSACALLDTLITTRLFGEEKDAWIEKCVVARLWISCTTFVAEGALEQVRGLLDLVMQNAKSPFSAQATHAAQTLLWKQVEANFARGQFQEAEAWCGICIHSLFDKAGEINISRIARKMILCALSRHDYASAREVFSKMSETGRNERVTRYLMYKAALHEQDSDLAAECFDLVCRQSSKDTKLLYACVLEAQQSGSKRQGIAALEKMLEKYNYNTPSDVHLPALLRMTLRLLISEMVKDGKLDMEIFTQVCSTFEAASTQARASRRRPSNASRQQFTAEEFAWFSKNSFNLATKYCAECDITILVQLLSASIEFLKLLKECSEADDSTDLSLRLLFCYYLSTCAFVTLARAEDNLPNCIQYYLQASKHGNEFRGLGALLSDQVVEASKTDIICKHFQIVKLELEAALKREQWDELDDLFEECWKYGGPTNYDTLADLVLVIYSCMSKENVDSKYQNKVLVVLQKIINKSGGQPGSDITKGSRWIRCLFQLSLTYDQAVSLRCVEFAIQIASRNKGTPTTFASCVPETPPPTSPIAPPFELDLAMTDNHEKEPKHYPTTELEWLATTTFNHAIDFYIQEHDEKCKEWAEKALKLAGWAEDGNKLRDVLMEKYKSLTWGDE